MLTLLRIPDAGTSTARPKLARQETELLMSYYQSPLADQGISYRPPSADKRPTHRKSHSGSSTSSSDYSSSGSTDDHSAEDVQPVTRRASVPSEGGADRRRLAIVQMDAVRETGSGISSKPNTARSRRGLETRLDGLALIAPPDAAPRSYEYLTSPTAARSMHPHLDEKSHTRSASEATGASKPSRDVGIVGTATPSEPPKKPRVQTATEALVPPVFQEPHSSRASSPNVPASSLAPPQVKRRSTDLSVHTPEIGQAKEIHVPVASPVIVDLGPDASLRVGNSTFERRSPALQVVEPRSTSPLPLSSYLHYQPGVHATAGPLPPPPRAAFNIDTSTPPPPRPPRLHSPPPRRRGDLDRFQHPHIDIPVHLPGPTSGCSPVLAAAKIPTTRLITFREGAFSPSTISTTPSTSPSDSSPTTAHPTRTIDGMIPSPTDGSKGSGDSASSSSSSAAPAPVVISGPPRTASLPEQSGEDWTYVNRDLTASPSSDGHVSHDRVSWESYSPRQSLGSTPSPPPKSFKASLTTNLKALLLVAASDAVAEQVTQPVIEHAEPRADTVAIISQYPAALFCADVVSRKSAQERCAMYAQKINELYVHDCGLSEWVLEARFRGSNGPGKRTTLTPSTQRAAPQARHVSRSSMQSDATFPTRPDAMVATDLSTKPGDIAPAVPSLPYPALSPRSLATGNFFASLGRKASVSRKDRPNPMSFASSAATTTRLVKIPPVSANPRPVFISNTPSVPGGPRAPPNRALRAQSILPSSSFSSNSSDRSSTMVARRPSLFTPTSSSSSGSRSPAGGPDRDFERQVDKLADLLPQAERGVLAGYLRRAGQDILAIGQYLEDEKSGTLRRD
ncbi:hypothetical protein DFH09DRAFT_1303863 [Mycena vulgaris]|nr:hypothetical protein DFH09DRAFT_1303863 [Mycena vulgaris]